MKRLWQFLALALTAVFGRLWLQKQAYKKRVDTLVLQKHQQTVKSDSIRLRKQLARAKKRRAHAEQTFLDYHRKYSTVVDVTKPASTDAVSEPE